MVQAWFLVALAASFAGYAAYLVGLRRNLVEPNRASWLIWSAATAVEASTYAAVDPNVLQRWVFLFGLATIYLLRSVGFRIGCFFVLDAIRTPANLFKVC